MRLLVFGSRDFTDRQFLFNMLDRFAKQYPVDVVIEGEARGADLLGREWAEDNDIPVRTFPADWDKNGKAAGPIRNRQMLIEGQPDYAVGFVTRPIEQTKGSRNMFQQLIKAHIAVDIYEC